MKKLNLLIVLLLSISLSNCGSDVDATPVNQNGITIAGNFTATPNAYVVFDRTAPYDDGFFFILANGTAVNDAGNNVNASTDTTIAAALLVDNGGATLASQSLVDFNIRSYTLDKDDTAVVDNITAFTDTYTANGTSYGQIDQDSAINYLIENAGSATFNISALTKDFITRTGTISCTFSMTDDNGVIITGAYTGTYIMLN